MFHIITMWYEGKSFFDIIKKSDMYEGSIIRNIKRLFELMKSLIECSNILVNKQLKEKLEEAS